MDFTNYLTMRSSNVATMRAAHLSLSTLTGSTLSLTTHITAPMAIYSTMTGSTMHGSTVFLSSIRASFLTLSTLTVSSINNNAPGTGTGAFSTLAVSSLNAVSSITVSSINVTTGNVGIGSTMPLQLLYVDNGNIGINSRNQISGGAALYFYNTPYGWSTAAKTAIITEGVNNYTMSKLHLCTNGVDDLTTSASVSNARLTIMPWGFIGINNTNPTANLDIIGSLRITSQTYAAITSGTGIDIIYSGGGSMSCGTRGVGGVLTAATMGYAASTHTFYTGTNAGTTAMTINSSGQVGIGTAPGYPLDVNGVARITSGLLISSTNVINFGHDVAGKEANAGKMGYQTFTTGALDIVGAGTGTRLIKLWDNVAVGSNLGVGINVPIAKFNVVGGESVFNGNVYLNSNANTVTPNPATYWGVGIKMAAEDNGWTGSDLNIYVSWQGGAWYKGFRFDNTGRAYNYNNTWGGLSDVNMKENIINARNYLDDLRLLRVVKYSLKADQLTEPNQLGLIAQEVEAIFPSLVSEDKDGLKYLKTSIIGMMQLKSIQELANKNDALEAKNAELTQKLDRLLAWAQSQGFSG